MILDIPEIPEELFEKIDQFRGDISREGYVLIILQNEVLGNKPRVFPRFSGAHKTSAS